MGSFSFNFLSGSQSTGLNLSIFSITGLFILACVHLSEIVHWAMYLCLNIAFMYLCPFFFQCTISNALFKQVQHLYSLNLILTKPALNTNGQITCKCNLNQIFMTLNGPCLLNKANCDYPFKCSSKNEKHLLNRSLCQAYHISQKNI